MNSNRGLCLHLAGAICIGLTLRLLLAYVVLPNSGYATDEDIFCNWALTLAKVGPAEFYEKATFVLYPPVWFYVLWPLGEFSIWLSSVLHTAPTIIAHLLIKVPPILLDELAAIMIYKIVRDLTEAGRNGARKALVGALLYLVNPVTWYDSAVWGQNDAAGACALLLGVIALMRWPPEVSSAAAVFAGMIKPQFGVILCPLVAGVLLKRHLVPLFSTQSDVSMPFAERLQRRDGPVRILTSVLTGVLVFYILFAPFGLGFLGFVDQMSRAALVQPFMTNNAYNLWALIGSPDLSLPFRSPDITLLVGSVTANTVGTLSLLVGLLAGVSRLLWRSDRHSIIVVGAYFSLCLFMLPTCIHERYLFYTSVFASVLAVMDRKWRFATVILIITTMINLHGVLTRDGVGTPNVTQLMFGEAVRSHAVILFAILCNAGLLVFAFLNLRPTMLSVQSRVDQYPRLDNAAHSGS